MHRSRALETLSPTHELHCFVLFPPRSWWVSLLSLLHFFRQALPTRWRPRRHCSLRHGGSPPKLPHLSFSSPLTSSPSPQTTQHRDHRPPPWHPPSIRTMLSFFIILIYDVVEFVLYDNISILLYNHTFPAVARGGGEKLQPF